MSELILLSFIAIVLIFDKLLTSKIYNKDEGYLKDPNQKESIKNRFRMNKNHLFIPFIFFLIFLKFIYNDYLQIKTIELTESVFDIVIPLDHLIILFILTIFISIISAKAITKKVSRKKHIAREVLYFFGVLVLMLASAGIGFLLSDYYYEKNYENYEKFHQSLIVDFNPFKEERKFIINENIEDFNEIIEEENLKHEKFSFFVNSMSSSIYDEGYFILNRGSKKEVSIDYIIRSSQEKNISVKENLERILRNGSYEIIPNGYFNTSLGESYSLGQIIKISENLGYKSVVSYLLSSKTLKDYDSEIQKAASLPFLVSKNELEEFLNINDLDIKYFSKFYEPKEIIVFDQFLNIKDKINYKIYDYSRKVSEGFFVLIFIVAYPFRLIFSIFVWIYVLIRWALKTVKN